MNIAIVGLGRVGTEFLEQMLAYREKGVHIVAVAEIGDTEGKHKAESEKIPLKSTNQIVEMGDEVDLIFDLSGNTDTRREIRELLAKQENRHTVVAPENFAYLLWTITTNKPLPDVHKHKGY